MIRIERDPAFWRAVAAHPQVAARLAPATPAEVAALAAQAGVLPLAAEHGGFLFVRRDPLGFACELHTLFTPEGRGREAQEAAVAAARAVWACGFQAIVTLEARANPLSRPPRTFGFARCGEWRATPLGELRMWMLTRAAFEASAANQRRTTCP